MGLFLKTIQVDFSGFRAREGREGGRERRTLGENGEVK
jgi:hypothetical protein